MVGMSAELRGAGSRGGSAPRFDDEEGGMTDDELLVARRGRVCSSASVRPRSASTRARTWSSRVVVVMVMMMMLRS